MKKIAAQDLGLPHRRLCDHVFQYSPVIHRDRLQKSLIYWQELIDIDAADKEQHARITTLANRNKAFLDNVDKRIILLEQLLENRDLHPYIVELASRHSTSGAIRTYVAAIRHVGQSGAASLSPKWYHLPSATGRNQDRKRRLILSRIQFIRRKQRAHPGFDLHSLLQAALSDLKIGKDMIDWFGGLFESAEASPASSGQIDAKKREVQQQERAETINLTTLRTLQELPAKFDKLIFDSQAAIAVKLWEIIDRFFGSSDGTRYIVSHGYSSAVLANLRHILQQFKEGDSLPRIFSVLGEMTGDLDTRVMEYELYDQADLRARHHFAAGTSRHLMELVSPNDIVVVLLGAEAFDATGAMVHPRGIEGALKSLVCSLRQKCITMVILVGEEYKRQRQEDDEEKSDEKKTDLRLHTQFFCQHFDRIDIYGPGLVDLAVTEKKTYPADYSAVLARVRQARPS